MSHLRLSALCTTLMVGCSTAPQSASPTSASATPSQHTAPAAASSAVNRHAAPPASAPRSADQPLSTAERERAAQLCNDLDDPNLDQRIRAQEQLQRDFIGKGTRGGTERQLEACAEWCATRVGTAPDWYNPQAQPSFDLSGGSVSQP